MSEKKHQKTTKSKKKSKALPKCAKGKTLWLKFQKHKGETYLGIRCLKPKRFTIHGFGAFLNDVKPQEVLAGKGVIKALCEQPERRGLQGMDFWVDNRIGFCATLVPLEDISVPEDAKKWIKKFVEEEPEP